MGQSGDEQPFNRGTPENCSTVLDILSPKKIIKASARIDGEEVWDSAGGFFTLEFRTFTLHGVFLLNSSGPTKGTSDRLSFIRLGFERYEYLA